MLKVILCLNVLVAVGGVSGPGEEDQNSELEQAFVIARNGVPKCSGVLVGERALIATAAHCVYGVSKSGLTVTSGSAKEYKIARVVVHPYYTPPSPDYDIALLKIEKNAENKTPSGLGLKKGPLAETDEVAALTWNLTETTKLQPRAKVALENRKSCRAKMSVHVVLSSRMLCANTISDSLPDGRVLLVGKDVLGIGSYYVRGADDTLPKIFTNIANSEIYSFVERYID